MQNTFQAIDGNQYEIDRWYELPFIFEGKPMVPTLDLPLQIKVSNERVIPWVPFYNPEGRKLAATKTHWRCPSWSDFSI